MPFNFNIFKQPPIRSDYHFGQSTSIDYRSLLVIRVQGLSAQLIR